MKEKHELIVILIVCLSVLLVLMAAIVATAKSQYRQGQIDALSGNAQYELIEHEDMTRTWEPIK